MQNWESGILLPRKSFHQSGTYNYLFQASQSYETDHKQRTKQHVEPV